MPLFFRPLMIAVAALGLGATRSNAEGFVAGVTPDRRPDGAPVQAQSSFDKVARERALRGVSKPYPPSLRFLEDQGGWYTPFAHPGMPGPYDIRGMHDNKKKS